MRIRVLGPLIVETADGVVDLRPREREILVALVVAGRSGLSETALIDAVWGDAAPPSARKSVQAHVARIRRALGTHTIERTATGYRVVAGQIDVDDAERAVLDVGATLETQEAALSAWRGDPFTELPSWPPAVAEAARLHELHLVLDELVAEGRVARDGPRPWIASLEGLAASQPLRERRWALLARALASEGRHTEALRALDSARRTLAETAGLSPSRDLTDLEAAILAGETERWSMSRPEPATTDPALVSTAQSPARPRPGRRRRAMAMIAGLVLAGGAAVSLVHDPPRARLGAEAEGGVGTTVAPGTFPASTSTTTVVGGARIVDVSCEDVELIATVPNDAQGPLTPTTRCLELEVPSDWAQPEGPSVVLQVVVEPGTDPGALPVVALGDPRLLSLGGPGDDILVPLRGLAGSDPELDCPEIANVVRQGVAGADPSPADTSAAAAECVERWATAGYDPTDFSSASATTDVRAAIAAMGHERVVLRAAGAIGTRVAQELAADPALVAGVLLVDPQPAGVAGIDSVGSALARAWARLGTICLGQTGCAATFGDLTSTWTAWTEELDGAPVDVLVTGNGSETLSVRVDGTLLQLALAYALDIPNTVELIPALVAARDAGSVGRFVGGVALQVRAADLGLTYVCTDELPFRNPEQAEANGRAAEPFGRVAAWSELVVGACAELAGGTPHTPGPAARTVPTLLVRGLLSPSLDPGWDLDLERAFPSQQRLDLGTVTFGTNAATPPCVDQLTIEFLTQPGSLDPSALSACAEQTPDIVFVGAP